MYKDILVHLDASAASERRLEAALALAERSEGHVTGLHVVSMEEGLPWADGYAVEVVMRYAAERAEADLEKSKAAFDRQVAGRACAHEWRTVNGPVERTVALHARYADLVVLGQTDQEAIPFGASSGIAENVPMSAGRPCLVMPYVGRFPHMGERVLVAWDGGREATRAVNDALPLLKLAKKVTVISVGGPSGPPGSNETASTDLATHLARHGITAEARNDTASDISVADLLLSLAADLSVDLLVMGAYGHTRMRELIMGGVTRAMLDRMTVPVLMSH
jgi:nucleotide-binding universal stress UspA family protein